MPSCNIGPPQLAGTGREPFFPLAFNYLSYTKCIFVTFKHRNCKRAKTLTFYGIVHQPICGHQCGCSGCYKNRSSGTMAQCISKWRPPRSRPAPAICTCHPAPPKPPSVSHPHPTPICPLLHHTTPRTHVHTQSIHTYAHTNTYTCIV